MVRWTPKRELTWFMMTLGIISTSLTVLQVPFLESISVKVAIKGMEVA
jgi:hypothetical protein